jgi:CelD/BcsL family acetyltransferase involved in cellulose biosynthesis
MTYLCSILRTADAVRGLRDALARVAEGPGASSGIVQHPDWIVFEATSRDDGTTPHVIVVHDSTGAVVGYAPLLSISHTARLDIAGRRVRLYRGAALRLLGGGVVADPGHRDVVELAIARQLAGDREICVVRIQEADLPNRFAAALSAGPGFRTVAAHLLDQVHLSIDPQPSSAAWLTSMDKKKRTDLTQRVGRSYRKLGDGATLHTFDRPEDMARYCALMNTLYARTWHHAELPIDWSAPGRVALFETLAAAGHLVGYMVIRDGQPLAYSHGYRVGGTYYFDDVGYDEDVAKAGIGSILVFQAVCALMDRYPGERISFGYGDNHYKRYLANREEPCGSLYVVRGTRATAGFHMYAPVRWLYQGLHRARKQTQARA